MSNAYDNLFRDVAGDRRAEPNRARDLRRCNECGVYAEHLTARAEGGLVCEQCRMEHVNAAIRAAARSGGIPAPAPQAPSCGFCTHTGRGVCQGENDRASCRKFSLNQAPTQEPAHV